MSCQKYQTLTQKNYPLKKSCSLLNKSYKFGIDFEDKATD